MTILVVHHAVRDYGAWKPAFDEHQPFRTAHGAIRHWLYRSPDDPDDLVVAIEFPSAEAALGFLADPSLKEAMERAGVIGEPSVHLREEIEAVEY
jgi:hypothetical protein